MSAINCLSYIKVMSKITCFRQGLNLGPSACKADVITTTLRKLNNRLSLSNSIFLFGNNCSTSNRINTNIRYL